jgi:replicative DNA helicase
MGVMETIVAKHRGGKKGIVRVGWKPEYTKFHDAPESSIYD